jgi:hypothetical protein
VLALSLTEFGPNRSCNPPSAGIIRCLPAENYTSASKVCNLRQISLQRLLGWPVAGEVPFVEIVRGNPSTLP